MYQKIIFNGCNAKFEKESFVCTREWLDSKLDSAEVRQLVEEYRLTGDDKVKGKLPMIFPHATFPNGKRDNESAVPSGLISIDVDDHENVYGIDPRAHFQKYIQPLLSTKLSHVLMVYVTASNRGFRVIAKRQRYGELIDEQRQLFAAIHGNLPLETMDTKTKALATPSFLTSREDLLYINNEELFGGEVSEGFAAGLALATTSSVSSASEASSASESNAIVAGTSAVSSAKLPISAEVEANISEDGAFYGETAFSEIVPELMRVDKIDLRKGNRNNSIYRLACQLRHICRSEQHIIQVLPFSGLSAQEVAETVHSACSNMRAGEPMDVLLKHVLERLCPSNQKQQSAEPAMPTRLPSAMKAILDPIAPSHRPAMAICTLPMLGALATHARFYYLNDEVHSLSFQTVLMAEQASGKSTMPKLHKLLMGKIINQDQKNRERMDEWRDEREANGENAAGPKNLHLPIRNINPKTTYPAFLCLMKDAHGEHLFVCAPEIDSLPANQWLQNGSTPRLAFDNECGGQDTKSTKAVSGYIPFYCNTCMSGTPSAVMNRYKNAEDGLVTRTCFCTFPDERGMKRQRESARSAANLKSVNDTIDRLMAYGKDNMDERKPVRLHKIEKALLKFYDMKGDLYNMTMNEAIETFRTRATVIGFRAGALAYLLEGCKETKAAIDFGLWVAEYTLYYQIKFFGSKNNEAVTANRLLLNAETIKSNDIIFMSLADEFTNSDIAALFQSRGRQGSGASQTGSRWELNRWVERVSRGRWRKTELGKARAELLSQSIDYSSLGESGLAS